jgi:hypothetical protein
MYISAFENMYDMTQAEFEVAKKRHKYSENRPMGNIEDAHGRGYQLYITHKFSNNVPS